MLDRDQLTSLVKNFREEIEPHWSEESAYRVPEIQKYGAYISGGQCAVTCLVLMDILEKAFPKEQITLVSGEVRSSGDTTVISDHGWLEIGSGGEAMIIDPTADQAKAINEKVIIDTKVELERNNLLYIAKEREDDHGELEHPKRFKRYQILRRAFEKN